MEKKSNVAKIVNIVLLIVGIVMMIVGGILMGSAVKQANEATVYPSITGITQQESAEDNPLYWTGFTLIVVGFLLAVCSVASYFAARKKAKFNAALNDALQHMGNNPVRMSGIVTNKKEKGKAATKTVLSILGGLISSLFLGVGVYSVYGSEKRMEFVLSDDGLFLIDPTQPFSTNSVALIAVGKFNDCTVEVNKNKIVYTDNVNGDVFKMAPDDKNMLEELALRLREIASKPERAAEDLDDPFAE